jgi:hypothetical protein
MSRFLCLICLLPLAVWAVGTPGQEAARLDSLLASAWKDKGIPAPAQASDEVFLRRVWLDLAGRAPTLAEATTFLADRAPDKRARLIDVLLASEAHVSHAFNQWADVLRLKSRYTNTANVVPAAYARWLRESLRRNQPYDAFVRDLLSAKGYAWENGAIGYYLRDPGMPLDNLALTSRVFLGTRIECAQCHNHPFDQWKQTQFYRLAAYTYGNKTLDEAYAGVRDEFKAREEAIRQDYLKEKATAPDGGKAAEARRQERMEAIEFRRVLNIVRGGTGQLFSPIGLARRGSALKLPHDFKEDDGKPFEVMTPQVLWAPSAPVAAGQDPAEAFARWVTSPENPRFTRVIVNRLWRSLFGVAVLEPLDDLRDGTPSAVPGLEDRLEELMRDLRYDQRAFLAIVARTRAYQAVAQKSEPEPGAPSLFAGPYLRRLTAEQAWDSLVALANPEPDAPDRVRQSAEDRRIEVSHMAFDAFQSVSGKELLDMAYARLATEKAIDAKLAAIRADLVDAKRQGSKDRELALRRQEGALNRERGEGQVNDFILPLLRKLAQHKGAELTKLPLYKLNPNPAVMGPETWRSMHVTGYGPPPLTVAQAEDAARAERARLRGLAASSGLAGAEADAFADYCLRARGRWVRASELESPAERGHFLRTLGQSDRDFVENANRSASIPQALLFLNGDLGNTRGLLEPYAPLSLAVRRAEGVIAKVDAVFLSVLSRRATPAEQAICGSLASRGDGWPEELAYALLNSRQFFFEQ